MHHDAIYIGQVCWTTVSQPGGLVEILAHREDPRYGHVAHVRHVLDHPYGSTQGTRGWYPITDLQPCAWPDGMWTRRFVIERRGPIWIVLAQNAAGENVNVWLPFATEQAAQAFVEAQTTPHDGEAPTGVREEAL